jgi:hypothetical protein
MGSDWFINLNNKCNFAARGLGFFGNHIPAFAFISSLCYEDIGSIRAITKSISTSQSKRLYKKKYNFSNLES